MAIISDGFFREGMGGAPVSASYLTTAADPTLTAEVVLTATQTELNYVGGVTSAIQTQINNKSATGHTHTLANVTDVTASITELNYIDGVTSAIQTQMDAKAPLASPTFTGTVVLPSGTVTEAMQVLADNVTRNVSTTAHGYAPKAPNDTTKFLRGDASWAVPTGGGLTLLETFTADGTASTYTTTADLSGYSALLVKIMGRTSNAITFQPVGIRFNADAGANYDHQFTYDYGNTTSHSSNESLAATSATAGDLTGASAAANNAGALEIFIPEYAGTTFFKNFTGRWGGQGTTGTGDILVGHSFGQWRSTVAITSVTFLLSAGNFVNASKIRIYGVP